MFNLKEIISSIADVGQKLFKKSVVKKNDLESIISLCDDLISNKGAAFGITVARDITDLYQTLSNEKKLLFFICSPFYFVPSSFMKVVKEKRNYRTNT